MADEKQIAEAVKLLAEHGFRVSIRGCGCCGSPSVYLEHNGRPIIFAKRHENDTGVGADEADWANIDMMTEPLAS